MIDGGDISSFSMLCKTLMKKLIIIYKKICMKNTIIRNFRVTNNNNFSLLRTNHLIIDLDVYNQNCTIKILLYDRRINLIIKNLLSSNISNIRPIRLYLINSVG
jgi:hypothetical protein